MNLTLSVSDEIIERAREVARQQGTSLNALVREYLERIVSTRCGPSGPGIPGDGASTARSSTRSA